MYIVHYQSIAFTHCSLLIDVMDCWVYFFCQSKQHTKINILHNKTHLTIYNYDVVTAENRLTVKMTSSWIKGAKKKRITQRTCDIESELELDQQRVTNELL